MAQVKIGNKQYDSHDCLAINIGENTYNMPLANRMSLKVLKKISKSSDSDIEDIIDILSEYIPEDIIEELTVSDVKAIFEAWSTASKDVNGGVELGK